MFEYKVRCRHKLGWKEIKLYADTDIEEFFNRNSIDYVRNMTDTAEHRQLKEIERLNNELQVQIEDNTRLNEYIEEQDNIIKEVREYLEEDIKSNYFKRYDDEVYKIIDKLLEILKGE